MSTKRNGAFPWQRLHVGHVGALAMPANSAAAVAQRRTTAPGQASQSSRPLQDRQPPGRGGACSDARWFVPSGASRPRDTVKMPHSVDALIGLPETGRRDQLVHLRLRPPPHDPGLAAAVRM